MADPKRKTRKGKKIVRVPLTTDQQQRAEQVVVGSLKDNPDVLNLPESKRSIDDLTSYCAQIIEGSTRILPKEKHRYVIYFRKSTDDEAKQVRSLEDKETEYLALADHQSKKPRVNSGLFTLVGVTGLEPATSRPPAVRATNCATPRRRDLRTCLVLQALQKLRLGAISLLSILGKPAKVRVFLKLVKPQGYYI